MNVIGIETSCDETAVGIVGSDKTIRANLILSQLEEHSVFGGVVPEIAARAHLDHLDDLIKAALGEAQLSFDDIDAVAATTGPGLIGGVMVGMMAGKAMAAALNKPFIAVNHLEAHVLTCRLTHDIDFPYLVLLASGGHTQILVAEGVGQYRQLGTTLDDAIGECFDKSAKLMGLPYPGGPQLEKAAEACQDPQKAMERFDLPRPLYNKPGCNFSFSGLKTAVRSHVDRLPEGPLNREDVNDIAYALQRVISEVVVNRCEAAIQVFIEDYKSKSRSPTLTVVGGVAANKTIRAALENLTKTYDMNFCAPPMKLCTDNGLMIAWAGHERYKEGLFDKLDVAARPRWPLEALK